MRLSSSSPLKDETAHTVRAADSRHPFLVALGERIRALRARKGLARKALALDSHVSERHLANLELGMGNASIMVLRQIADALDCPLVDLLSDPASLSPESMLIRDLLAGRSEEDLRCGRIELAKAFELVSDDDERHDKIALIGLRGAGKSSLGRLLAEQLDMPFIELGQEIERVAGCSIREIYDLFGPGAYRRYERRALEETIQLYPEAVIAAPGGVVSDAGGFNLLLAHCYTVWIKASAQEHMTRVLAQGDLRPMAGKQEAMNDLQHILDERSPFYGRADLTFSTAGTSLSESSLALHAALTKALSGSR